MNFLIADDHDIVRIGVKLLLQKTFPDCQIDETNNSDSVFKKVKEKDYDLVILDIQMDETSSIDYLKQLLLVKPNLKIIILSFMAEDVFGLHYIKAGAKAYVYKRYSNDILEDAIKTVLKGDRYYTKVLRKQMEEITVGGKSATLFAKLSERELEVLNHILQGLSTSEISNIMHLHHTTVCTYKSRIFEKFNTNNIMTIKELAAVQKLIQ